MWLEDACEANGIGITTYRRWLLVPAFRALVKKAEGTLQRNCLTSIGVGSDGWQGSAWIMERRFPSKWAVRIKRALMDREDELYRRLRDGLTPERYLEVVRVLAGQDEEGAPEGGGESGAVDDAAREAA